MLGGRKHTVDLVLCFKATHTVIWGLGFSFNLKNINIIIIIIYISVNFL